VIEVFADVWCPFAHVGIDRLVRRRASSPHPEIPLRIRAWPLELVNGVPLSAESVARSVAALRRHVAPDLFAGFDVDAFPQSTLPALDLTAAAYRQGDVVGERVALALRRALFEEGRRVDDAGVLDEIAEAHAIDGALDHEGLREAVLRDRAEGTERGVVGSPHYFFDGDGFFCPTLVIDHVDDQIEVAFDHARFRQFADRCFGS
jgi:predicted DsbA family dithiol-disulfide isomerase